jgi:pyruvate,orthophosphate dikinase
MAKIMIPLVGHVNELARTRQLLEQEAMAVQRSAGTEVDYEFGTMIEVPRAALTADEIAREADFFSFGTNDLTQMTFGYCRDAAESGFLMDYVERKILPANPFQILDDAVAALVRAAVDRGRSTKPNLQVGICGEHGGDAASIAKCEQIGLDYVSCSPSRVPAARLAAARAAIAHREQRKSASVEPSHGLRRPDRRRPVPRRRAVDADLAIPDIPRAPAEDRRGDSVLRT